MTDYIYVIGYMEWLGRNPDREGNMEEVTVEAVAAKVLAKLNDELDKTIVYADDIKALVDAFAALEHIARQDYMAKEFESVLRKI